MKASLNMKSVAYTGDTVFAADEGRRYLFIMMLTAAGTVEFGDGGGLMPIAISGFIEPYRVPSSKISVITTGNFIMLSDKADGGV